jgi:AraC family transcriptional regulator of adaptative response/methylated-DNA-[protein]-cysteine methyltransferase
MDKNRFQLSANSRNGVFCLPNCPAAGREPDTIPFESSLEALAAGFKPCRKCKPLQRGEVDPDWLETLMAAVEVDPARRWHDADLVELGLDPSLVRRWFVANHGMTFHAYARLRRMGLALRQIQHGEPVADAVIAHGFETESSFREAFTQVFGNPPSAVDRESCIWVNRVPTPLGSMIVGVSDQGLCLLEFAERRMLDTQLKTLRQHLGRVFLPGDHPTMQWVKTELDSYFNNNLQEFTVPLQAPGTGFQEAVWAALRNIPYGETRSYADIADEIGHPSAVRAVGRANGDNRIAIIIPCHRVVGIDGELIGYGGGLWRKEYLLRLEQAQSFRLS